MTNFNSLLGCLSDDDIRKKFRLLGQGDSRKVFALNEDLVLKLAKGVEGVYQNSVEHYVFTHAEVKLSLYLCPVVWFTPRMLVMRRAIPLSSTTHKKHINLGAVRKEPNAPMDLYNLTNKFMLYYEDIISVSSWGILKGLNVLIDYGCTNKAGDAYYNSLFSIEKYL